MTDQSRDDGWGVTDDYDVASFYPEATDGRGHSDNLRVRLKPEIAGEIGALVASGVIPEYATPQAVIRDAIVHRLHWLSENTDDPVLAAKMAEAVRRTVIEETTQRYTRLIDSFEEFISRTRAVCDRALKFGDSHGVAGYLDDVTEYAENSREPYRSMLLAVVKDYRSRLNLDDLLPETALDGGLGPNEEGTPQP
jgi:hypothetical protein